MDAELNSKDNRRPEYLLHQASPQQFFPVLPQSARPYFFPQYQHLLNQVFLAELLYSQDLHMEFQRHEKLHEQEFHYLEVCVQSYTTLETDCLNQPL